MVVVTDVLQAWPQLCRQAIQACLAGLMPIEGEVDDVNVRVTFTEHCLIVATQLFVLIVGMDFIFNDQCLLLVVRNENVYGLFFRTHPGIAQTKGCLTWQGNFQYPQERMQRIRCQLVVVRINQRGNEARMQPCFIMRLPQRIENVKTSVLWERTFDERDQAEQVRIIFHLPMIRCGDSLAGTEFCILMARRLHPTDHSGRGQTFCAAIACMSLVLSAFGGRKLIEELAGGGSEGGAHRASSFSAGS